MESKRNIYLKCIYLTKKTIIYRKDKNKVLLYSTGNYIQYPVINHNRKENKKRYIHIKLNHRDVQQELIKHCRLAIIFKNWKICPIKTTEKEQ